MASTIGTALGTTHTSSLPLPATVLISPLSESISWGCIKVATGLKATLKYQSITLEIPPCTPPEKLVLVLPSVLK